MKRDWAAAHPGQPWPGKPKDMSLPYRFRPDYKVKRGEFYFKRLSPQGYVVIEPLSKAIAPNRDWGWKRWQKVVRALPDVDWLQINPPGSRVLSGVAHKPAGSFLDAVRLLSGARAYVGPEGGLYHAAAALRLPAVAIFGGFVSPETQGYDDMVNIYAPEGSPCGMRVPCQHCRVALDSISVDQVVEGIRAIL